MRFSLFAKPTIDVIMHALECIHVHETIVVIHQVSTNILAVLTNGLSLTLYDPGGGGFKSPPSDFLPSHI